MFASYVKQTQGKVFVSLCAFSLSSVVVILLMMAHTMHSVSHPIPLLLLLPLIPLPLLIPIPHHMYRTVKISAAFQWVINIIMVNALILIMCYFIMTIVCWFIRLIICCFKILRIFAFTFCRYATQVHFIRQTYSNRSRNLEIDGNINTIKIMFDISNFIEGQCGICLRLLKHIVLKSNQTAIYFIMFTNVQVLF